MESLKHYLSKRQIGVVEENPGDSTPLAERGSDIFLLQMGIAAIANVFDILETPWGVHQGVSLLEELLEGDRLQTGRG